MKLEKIINKIINNKVILIIGKIVNNINSNRIYNRSAELAYYMIIGILAMLVTLMYSAHFIPNLIQTVDERFLSLLPDNIKDLILNALLDIKIPKSISVIIATSITSIWFVSRAMHSIMLSFDEIYDIGKKKVGIKSKGLSILFTLGLVAMFICLFLLTLIQTSLSELAFKYLNWSYSFFEGNAVLRLLISAGTMIIVFNVLYYYIPTKKIEWYRSVPGAVFATITWLIMTNGFTFYITNVSNFSWILGSLGSVFVFLIWVYYCSLFLLFGAVINSSVGKIIDKRKALKAESK